MENMVKHEFVEKHIEEILRELFEYKRCLESFDPQIQDEWYFVEQEAQTGLDRNQALRQLESFWIQIQIGRCKYCKIQMNTGGSTLADANAWHCPECGHEEVEMGSYSLGGRENPIKNCRCKNCIKEARE